MAFKMKGFPMISGTKPMKMAAKSAMKMKAAKAMKLKEEAAMKKKAMPDFPDVDGDGNTTESIKSATASVKKTPKQLKKAAMKLKEEKTPMKDRDTFVGKASNDGKTYKYTITPEYKEYKTARQKFNEKTHAHDIGYKPFEGTRYTRVEVDPKTKKPIKKAGDSPAPKMKKDSIMKMKKESSMKMGHKSPKKMGHKSAKKMKTPMKEEDKYFSLKNLKEAGKVIKARLQGKTVTAVAHSDMAKKPMPKPTMNVNKPKTPKKPKARF